MFDFGIKKFLLKVLLIVVGGVVLICIATVAGCGSVNGALAQKNIEETSDDSMDFSGAQVVPADIILATAEGKATQIRAKKEPWRIIAYTVGIPTGVGLFCGIILSILYFRAYLAQSPWDKTRGRG